MGFVDHEEADETSWSVPAVRSQPWPIEYGSASVASYTGEIRSEASGTTLASPHHGVKDGPEIGNGKNYETSARSASRYEDMDFSEDSSDLRIGPTEASSDGVELQRGVTCSGGKCEVSSVSRRSSRSEKSAQTRKVSMVRGVVEETVWSDPTEDSADSEPVMVPSSEFSSYPKKHRTQTSACTKIVIEECF